MKTSPTLPLHTVSKLICCAVVAAGLAGTTVANAAEMLRAALVSSCGGTQSQSCRVGEAVSLRATDVPREGVAYVTQWDGNHHQLLAGPVPVSAGNADLPVRLVPQASDGESGLTVYLFVAAEPLGGRDLARVLSGGTSSAAQSRLTLQVSAR
jgi:hypothetical protein